MKKQVSEMHELKLETERSGDVLRIRLEGELDMSVAVQLREALHAELESSPSSVVIDLSGVPFIDSSIIATLVDALKIVRNQGGDLRVENVQPAVKNTFEITRLASSFGIE